MAIPTPPPAPPAPEVKEPKDSGDDEVKTVFDMTAEELAELNKFNPHAHDDLPF